jgi:stress-induced morphogen
MGMVKKYAMFDPKEIERLIKESIPQSEVIATDLTGAFDHFEVTVASPLFKGKSKIEQHRMIYSALGDAVGGPIHALKINTKEI